MSTQLQQLLRLEIRCAIFARHAILRLDLSQFNQRFSKDRHAASRADIALANLPVSACATSLVISPWMLLCAKQASPLLVN
jgi:hypothetical protein